MLIHEPMLRYSYVHFRRLRYRSLPSNRRQLQGYRRLLRRDELPKRHLQILALKPQS